MSRLAAQCVRALESKGGRHLASASGTRVDFAITRFVMKSLVVVLLF